MIRSLFFPVSFGLAVIAGQSFLLTIGLDSANTHREKALAAVAGIAIVLAAVHFMWKHSWNFYLLESVIERENRRLGRHPVATGELVKSLRAEAPPEWTKFAVWAGPGDGGWRWYLVRDRRALAVWTAAFVVLLAIDVAILVKAAVDVI